MRLDFGCSWGPVLLFLQASDIGGGDWKALPGVIEMHLSDKLGRLKAQPSRRRLRASDSGQRNATRRGAGAGDGLLQLPSPPLRPSTILV
ncbi:hypothetical protein CCHR01_18966 [Colletotrichum chrysophilum]|uniref:Uncharacterized protein n=1 Tax=Colletotrichum chrysophilum TaxID=1836956 RepID=A0AAD8ZZM9_9PEZI|nr:hypothetical protein CCHR01_18966 [Colletotrichum chrysophilum]